MTRSRPITFLVSAAVLLLTALAVAACGGGGAATASPSPAPSKTTISATSSCSGACAVAWPPLLATGTPIAGTGLTASKVGTITRSDGTQQVTYNGHPVYLFIKDKKPGQTTGQGVTAFGAAWFALTPAGNQISTQPTTSGGGYGY